MLLSFSSAVALLSLATPTLAQSAVIDWSNVGVDAMGEATFGPRVDVPEEESLPIHALLDEQGRLGYFANADGFYGRPAHIEYQLVRRGSDGRLEALKVVGDANVPRGKLTWRTAQGALDAPHWTMPVQLQVRVRSPGLVHISHV